MSVNYSLLETQGYVVIPDFLNNKEIEFLRKDYINSKPNDYIADLKLFEVSAAGIFIIEKKIKSVLKLISKETQLDVDLLVPAARYYDNQIYYNKVTRPVLHQDHQIFYFLQQFYNYLNFWIPVIKPDPNKSGLTVIPFDKLAELMPNHVGKLINYGATRFYPDGNNTKFINDNTGEELILPGNIESIAVNIPLNEGDALVARGDVIHTGQDLDTDRLAISLRCTQSSAPIDKNKLFVGGEVKQTTLNHVPNIVQKVLDLCKEKDSDIITAGDFYRSVISRYNKQIKLQIKQ